MDELDERQSNIVRV